MMEVTERTIDIGRILADRMGPRARHVPSFVVRWLERVIHQDQVNDYIWSARDLEGVDWMEDCMRYLGTTLVINGRENLPDDDGGRLFTFVSNHPLGGADGIALGVVLGRRYDGRFRYLVNDLLMNLPGIAPLFIPINKTGANGRDFPRVVREAFESDNHIAMFPAGLCSRRKGGVIRDLPWKKTFIQKSVETGRDVVPIHFGGRNSDFFYNLANICKALGVKFNVAMLFLVDEMYRNRGKTFTVTIGEPIPWRTFDRSRTPAQWALWVQDLVYSLPGRYAPGGGGAK